MPKKKPEPDVHDIYVEIHISSPDSPWVENKVNLFIRDDEGTGNIIDLEVLQNKGCGPKDARTLGKMLAVAADRCEAD